MAGFKSTKHMPNIDALQLQNMDLDMVETFTSWVSDTHPTRGGDRFLPYLLLVFASGRELTLPLPRQRSHKAAGAELDVFRNALSALRDRR